MTSHHWAEKYRASKFDDIRGQGHVLTQITDFFHYFPNTGKAILLHGPAGTGKTSLANVIQHELNFELFELNASDFRNKEHLKEKLKPASEQASLFSKGKVLLVDEIDGLSSMKDRGGLTELQELIETTQFPIILTANNIWDSKFSGLRKKCKLIALKEIDYKDISLVLQDIAKNEGLNIDNQVLISVAVRSKGDVRAAINDLQTMSADKDPSSNYLNLGERNKSIDIFTALKLVFKNMINKETLRIYDDVDLPLEKIFLWLEENIPYEYSGEELYKAYDILSLADVFRGRIIRQRHWRFLVYQNIFLSAGISLSKKSPKTGFTSYKKPTRVLKIWMNNQQNKHKNTIIAKYACEIHCSKKKAAKEFKLVRHLIQKPEIQKQLNLSEQEIAYANKIK
jgi:replication factor C large subunit